MFQSIIAAFRDGSLAFLPIFFLLGLGALLFAFIWLKEIKPTAKLVALICGGLIFASAVLAVLAPTDVRWTVLFSILPAVLIITFGILRFNARQPAIRKDHDSAESTARARRSSQAVAAVAAVIQSVRDARTQKYAEPAALKRIEPQVEKRVTESFSPAVIAFLYGVPALLCAAVVSSYITALFLPSGRGLGALASWAPFQHGNNWMFLVGARYGCVGAYIASLLFLGERAIRRELTNGAAVWAVIVLALGPLLAAAVAALFAANAKPGVDSPTEWSNAVVYLVAGMSPKWIVGVLTEVTQRLLKTNVSAIGNRLVPLTQLKGVTEEIASRLAEEGILDARIMAMADPVILFRNTNYPRRVILDWIDEAMLITTLPENWQAIERAGVTGAIDLAWLWFAGESGERGGASAAVMPGEPVTTLANRITPETAPARASGDGTPASQLLKVAELARMDPHLLRGVAMRFYEDAQVNLIWYLYQFEDGVPENGAEELLLDRGASAVPDAAPPAADTPESTRAAGGDAR